MPWTPYVLMEAAQKAPSMEATAANFTTMAEIIKEEDKADESQSSQQKCRKRTGTDEPRGPTGAREYVIEGKGRVRRVPIASPSGTSRPYARRFKEERVTRNPRVDKRARQRVAEGVTHTDDDGFAL